MSTGAYVGIPKTYTPVEYIESTGTQYIDTGYQGYMATTEIKFSQIDISGSTNNGICGVWNANNNRYYALYANLSSSPKRFSSYITDGTEIILQNSIDTNIHTVVYNDSNNKVLFDNVEKGTVPELSSSSTRPIYLFAANWEAGASILAKSRIYYAKIVDKATNTLVRDFIPVLDENNVACLYDLVEGKFYYNAGSGTFSYGTASTPVTIGSYARKVKKMYVGIPKTYTPVEYIESSGTQYIDTGIVRDITKVFRFVASVKWNDVSTRQCIGAQGYVYFGVSGGQYQIAQGGTTTTSVTATTGSFADIDLTFNCPSNTCTGTVNNTSIGTISATYQNSPTDAHIHLFSLNDLVLPSSVQIASFKIYQNDVLVRDFIPVLNDSNVACMFDLVESKFHYNAGTGTFTYGTVGTPVAFRSFARKVKKAYVGVSVSYTPIEYIGNSGTQYIDTNCSMNSNSKIEIKVDFANNNRQECIFCGRDFNSGGTGTNNFTVFKFANSQYRMDYNSIGTNFSHSVSASTPYIYAMDKNNLYENNTLIRTEATATFTTTNTLFLMAARNHDGTINNWMQGKLYYCKIWNGSTLVRDFIPVVDQDGVACLYDLVEGKFYYNSGTGTFTAGSTTGEPVVVGSVARLCFKGTTIWEAFIELCRANPTKSAASRVLQYQTQIENLMAQNGKDVNSYHSIYAHTDGSGFEVIFVVPTTYWYKYNETVSGNVYAFYISGRSGSQSVDWLSASDIRYYANTSWVEYSNDVIGVFSKASSGGSPSANCVVEVMSE